jgi:hypothetical protein
MENGAGYTDEYMPPKRDALLEDYSGADFACEYIF